MEKEKPIAQVTGRDGNTLAILSTCTSALKQAGMADEAKELTNKVFEAKSYEEALRIMSEYCELV